MSYSIFTNNPTLASYMQSQPRMADYEVKLLGSPAMEVLVTVKTAVRQGGTLISDPLIGVRMRPTRPGSHSGFRPNLAFMDRSVDGSADKSLSLTGTPVAFNPYVSVVVEFKSEALDFQSVKRIEEALALYRNNAKMRITGHSDNLIGEFQALDMWMIVSILDALL